MYSQVTHNMISKTRVIITIMVVLVSQIALAVDGVIIRSKASKSSAAFSNMKKNLNLSLHSGFNLRDTRTFGFKRVGKETMFNSMVTFQKGNITYVIPYKHKNVLQRFKTPQKPQQ